MNSINQRIIYCEAKKNVDRCATCVIYYKDIEAMDDFWNGGQFGYIHYILHSPRSDACTTLAAEDCMYVGSRGVWRIWIGRGTRPPHNPLGDLTLPAV
jgi:hypothetical protein